MTGVSKLAETVPNAAYSTFGFCKGTAFIPDIQVVFYKFFKNLGVPLL